MTIIIGVDPGSRYTGYGIIRLFKNQTQYLGSGYLQLTRYPVKERLQKIFFGLSEIVQQYQPDAAAIEQVFMHQNPNAALKLGQARGAAIVALGLPIAEYSARQVKQSVVGYGAADKTQVQHMVQKLLNINTALQVDEADGLAVALCHAHSFASRLKTKLPGKSKHLSSWRQYQPGS